MVNRYLITMAAVVALVCSTFYNEAQAKPKTHDGFYMQINLGLGYFHSSADIAGTEHAFSGLTIPTSILMGGTLFDRLVIGGGFFLDTAPSPSYSVDGTDVSVDIEQFVVGLGGFVDFYLNPDGGFHFPLFLGWGGLETSADGNAGGSDPTGFVMYFGAGYEWFFADEWSVGALARLVIAPISINDVTYLTFAPGVVATLTWH